MVEQDANKAILYTPLGEEDFDKEKFVEGYSQFSGLEEIVSTISKGGQLSAKLTSLAGEILHRDKSFYFDASNAANIEESCNSAFKEAKAGLEKYIGKNLKELKSKVPTEAYAQMVPAVKLNKKEKDDSHNEIVSAQEEWNKFSEAARDESKTIKYLADKMKKAPKWAKAEFERMHGNEKYVQHLMNAYGSHYKALFEYLTNQEGYNAKATFDKSLENASKNKGDYLTLIGRVAAPIIAEELKKAA